jgi:hypothetical protein
MNERFVIKLKYVLKKPASSEFHAFKDRNEKKKTSKKEKFFTYSKRMKEEEENERREIRKERKRRKESKRESEWKGSLLKTYQCTFYAFTRFNYEIVYFKLKKFKV